MNQDRLLQVLRYPHVSEKTTRVGEQGNQYVFEVAIDANKHEIKAAVEQLFEVNVRSVNTVRMPGKKKMFRFQEGRRPAWKKAYVRIGAEESIELGLPAEG
jgi:large subunit ribosomal protein L23